MRTILLAPAAALALLGAPAAAREAHAILIGASTYPNLRESFWLKGPGNDVDLVATFLQENPALGFERDNMIILADGLPGADGEPTLAAIRAAFAEVAAKVRPGDFVYLHFAGHGSQAPAADPDSELDGLDEIFLPMDVGTWSDSVGHVENALVDDEIGALIDSLRFGGADVWAVFDACHSGTATRAAPAADDEVTYRQLPPEALGVPDAALAAAAADSATRALPDPRARPAPPVAVAAEAAAEGIGSLVAFFAAQTDEVTPEKRLPRGDPDRRPHGVFTWLLVETLAERPGLTYRQLAQEVLRKYATSNLARTTPLFEGDLDRAVFGAEGAERVPQWPLRQAGGEISIPAGTLHGLETGTRLALVASPADPTEAALGLAEVVSADTFRAVVRLVAGEDGTAIAAAGISAGAYLRKLDAGVDFTLTVALPEGGGAAAEAMRAAAAELAAAAALGPRIRFVEPGAEADLRLAVIPDSPRPDAVWILPATGLFEPARAAVTPSIATADKTVSELAQAMAETLAPMARTLNLMKLGAAAGGGDLGVTASLYRMRAEADWVQGPDGRYELARVELLPGTEAPLPAGTVPRLVPNDVIGLEAVNGGGQPVDVNVLYIGADYSITFMGNHRMLPGDRLKREYTIISPESFGRDRLVVIFTPAERQTAVEDLSFLAQDPLTMTRAVVGGAMAGLFDEAGFGETTRGAVSLAGRTGTAPAAPSPAVLQFEIETVPPG
jgi:hypothetical protein